MSEVTAILSSRVVAGPRAATAHEDSAVEGSRVAAGPATTLAELPVGGHARVVGFASGLPPETARRLFDLGFAPGALVRVVRRAPLRDPIVFRVVDYDIALRRADAEHIRVTEAS